MTPFQDAWNLLKNITDMVEYPEGSGNFMSLRDMHEARNAQSRANLEQAIREGRKPNRDEIFIPQGAISAGSGPTLPEALPTNYSAIAMNPAERRSMLTHGSGRYDPNNPDAMHPMRSGQ